MRVLQFTDPEDLKSLTKKLPKCKFPEDFMIALQAKQGMIDILESQRWLWLSANQVWIQKKFFMINTPKLRLLCINPSILSWEGSVIEYEWCLSFANGKRTQKKRFRSIKAQWYEVDENWEKQCYQSELWGIQAIVFQHEMDHMNWLII